MPKYKVGELWFNPMPNQRFFLKNIYVYCVQSEDVHRAIYESNWHTQSKIFKDLARMMMMRAQKPVRVTAGRFGTLSLPLFAGVSIIILLRKD